MKRIALLALAALLVVAAWLVRPRGGGAVAPPSNSSTGDAGDARSGDGGSLALREAAPDVARSSAATVEPARMDLVAEEDLVALLAAIARAEVGVEARVLEELLARIVGDRTRLEQVLALLERDESVIGRVARRGGVIAVAVAFARWSRGGAPEGFDATEFCRSVLASLPRQPAETRALLVGFLVGTEIGDRPAIPGSLLPEILDLCRRHPEDAALYAGLLEHLRADPAAFAEQRGALLAILASGTDEHLVVPSVRALLALDPLAGSTAARVALDAAPPGSSLRTLLVTELAHAAPPGVAVDVVATAADGTEFTAFQALARRADARDEVRGRYNALLAANLDARARRRLVASMGGDESTTLLDIGATDPHPEVRKQAFLTATAWRDVGPEGLRSIRDAYGRRGTQGGIDARCAITSASNVVLRSNGAARDDALALLGEIARDTSASDSDRRAAYAKLRPHVPREQIEDLRDLDPGGGQAVK